MTKIFPDIFRLNPVAQGTVFLFQRQSVNAPAVYAVSFRPVFEDVFTQLRVSDLFYFLLVAPGIIFALFFDKIFLT